METSVLAWAEALETTARGVIADVIAYVPQLAGALLLLILGWLVARITRAVIIRGTSGLVAGLSRILPGAAARRLRVSQQALRVTGSIGFWIVLLLFATAAAEAASLPLLSDWLDQLVAFMPRALAAAAVILIGYVLSGVARDAVAAPLAAAGIAQANLVGIAAQATVLVASLIIGVSQIGVDVTFLTIVSAIALGSLLISFAVAFALGARDLVANLIGVQQMRTRFLVGQTVRIGEVEGEILEFTPSAVVIDGEEGTVSVPGQRFSTADTLLRPPRPPSPHPQAHAPGGTVHEGRE